MKNLKFQIFKLFIMISLLVSMLSYSFNKTLENRVGFLQVKGGKV